MKRKLLGAVRIAAFTGLTLTMLVSLLASERLVQENRRRALRVRRSRRWANRCRRIFGVEVIVEGEVPEGALLVMANHRAALDILILLEIFGGHIVSRADLARWPLIGAAAKSVGTIFVDRSNMVSGGGALREIERALLRGGRVTVFPEGTTFVGDEVRPLAAAALLPAARAGANVVPVGLAYETGSGAAFVGETFGAHLLRATREPHTRVAVVIGATVQAGTSKDEKGRRRSLSNQGQELQRDLQALVDRARLLVDARDV